MVVTYRNGLVENIHHAHIAIVDARGKLLYSLSDADGVIWARSTAKSAQALAILETGAFEKFTFDEADLALMCASHSSEICHIEQTLSMLHKVNAQESDMRCGAHQPLSDAVHRSWIKSNFSPTAVCSNCSGKHLEMLGGAQALGASMNEYHLSSHSIQVLVRQVVARLCESPEDSIQWRH